MATITKHGNSWQAKVRRLGFPSRSKTFNRKTDATAWARELERRIDQGKALPSAQAGKHTVAEAIEKFTSETLPNRDRNKSAANTEQRLTWWTDMAGSYSLEQFTPEVVAELVSRLRRKKNPRGKTISPQTVKHYINAISAVMSAAEGEYFWVDSNPVRKIKKPAIKNNRVRFLSDDEREALLKACRGVDSLHLYDIVVLALSTGMRQGEILNLQWPQVNTAGKRITLEETKNGERRVVPLAGHALEILQNKVRHLKSDFVFYGNTKSGHCEIRQSWRKVIADTGIENFRFHDLRHSAASYLAMQGASLLEIADILGHKTLAMVQRYAHLSEAHTTSIVEKMNEGLF